MCSFKETYTKKTPFQLTWKREKDILLTLYGVTGIKDYRMIVVIMLNQGESTIHTTNRMIVQMSATTERVSMNFFMPVILLS